MIIHFHIEYYVHGEEKLFVNCGLGEAGCKKLAMQSGNGHDWTAQLELGVLEEPYVDYHYSVELGGRLLRQEWHVLHHRLEFTSEKSTSVQAYDYWIDEPADTYLYSSAYVRCVAGRQLQLGENVNAAQGVRLKVRAPQLLSNQQLYVVGDCNALGKWDVAKADAMYEHAHGEWVVGFDALRLPRDFQFKFIAKNSDNGNVLWENGNNRFMHLPVIDDDNIVVYELQEARFPMSPWRVAGTVVPVPALRTQGSFGVGDFGDLRMAIDWVASTGQHLLQVLPINDTTSTHTWTDSYPYNSISVHALHPMYIDLRQLPELPPQRMKHYDKLRLTLNALPQVDYEGVNNAKLAYLREVYELCGKETLASLAFRQFFDNNDNWLVPYAAFCYWRDKYGTADFSHWPAHRTFSHTARRAMSKAGTKEYSEVAFWYFVQFNLDAQMRKAHKHARSKGVILKGDIPIGVNRHSVETWLYPEYFNMNWQAGAPPDAFSKHGQNWGFPTYNWDNMLADGCTWWTQRLEHLARYFDAYRIDHVLGFFRIWEIPIGTRNGLLGHFSPAKAYTRVEIASYGLAFDEKRFVSSRYSENVLFMRDGKGKELFHPRFNAQDTAVYASLSDVAKKSFDRLYFDYYYTRNNAFWREQALMKLPPLLNATLMLPCAEDLGMVPGCVPEVLRQLRVLSLEIQSMPKHGQHRFSVLAYNPYLSVDTIATHDMPTLRMWWDEDKQRTQQYYNAVLWQNGDAPHPLPGSIASLIVENHLKSPSMICAISIQDWLSIDEALRNPDANAERINVPSDAHHYWRYRMHVGIEQLMSNAGYTSKVRKLVDNSGRL